jgi:hypothetical protein
VLALLPLVLLAFLAAWVQNVWRIQSAGWIFAAASLLWTLAAYAFGVRGLARARCGEGSDWFQRQLERGKYWAACWTAARRDTRTAFRSATAAQLWHEWRRNGRYLPAMCLFIGVPLVALMCSTIIRGDTSGRLMIGSTMVTPAMLGFAIFLGMPLMFSMLVAGGMGKFDVWGKEAMASFFAVRPMSNWRFVLIKMGGAALSVLAAWVVALTCFAVWACVEASPLNTHASIVRNVFSQSSYREVFGVVLLLIVFVVITWANIVAGMWISLAGRTRLALAIGVAWMTFIAAAMAVGAWVYRHPDLQTQLWTLLPWLLGCFLLLKACAAVGVTVVLRKRRTVEMPGLGRLFLGWIAIVAGLLLSAWYFTPLTWTMAAGIIAYVPLARLAAAPLALSFNRHR